MSLPTGVFWAVGIEIEDVHGVFIFDDDSWSWPPVGFDYDQMEVDRFRHIHGVVPKPGEALKLDASRWSRHCQTCRSELNGSGVCRKCNVTRYAPGVLVSESCCHALVLDRKRLEDGK